MDPTKDIAFGDLSLEASDIARRINNLIDLVIDRADNPQKSDLERLFGKIDYYWFVAKTLGTEEQVELSIRLTGDRERTYMKMLGKVIEGE